MSWHTFEGHRVFYTREGAGDPIIFLPNATLTGRLWEHQAEHFKATNDVIVVDLPGFGQSEFVRPTLEYNVRWLERFVDDLDVAPAALVGNCVGSLMALHYASRHPDAVWALVLLNMLDRYVGMMPPLNRGAWAVKARRLRPLLEFGMRHMSARMQARHPYPNNQFGDIADPRQAEYVEHARRCWSRPDTRVAWLSFAYDVDNDVLPEPDRLAKLPPVCWVWGEANRLLPYEIGKRQLETLDPEEVHVIPGRGYAVAWEDPGEITAIIEAILSRHPRTGTRRPHTSPCREEASEMRSVMSPTRILYISGSIGLGHAARDLAIARELRAIDPQVEIAWFAGDPARRAIADAGETLVPECQQLDETAPAEQRADGFGFNIIGAMLGGRDEMARTVRAFLDVTRAHRYDLVIGDEAYAILDTLNRHPRVKRAPFVMIYDCVGVDAMSASPLERLVAYRWNRAWCGGRREQRSAADLTLFIGEPEDVPDRRFGPFLPNRREFALHHYRFVGYAPVFDPSDYADRRSVRRALGYDDRPLVVCAVGGTSIGAELLRLCAEAHPHIERRAPGARMVLVCGPRIDTATVPAPAGVEIRGYVPRLYEHLAACDVAIVQAGGTTTLELTALRRPFLYFPLEGHFEQEHVVAERLARHGAGVRMALRDTSPEQLADAAVAAMRRQPDWPPIPVDGARRAARLVIEMRRAHEAPTAVPRPVAA